MIAEAIMHHREFFMIFLSLILFSLFFYFVNKTKDTYVIIVIKGKIWPKGNSLHVYIILKIP